MDNVSRLNFHLNYNNVLPYATWHWIISSLCNISVRFNQKS
jgi:hypothetical protein